MLQIPELLAPAGDLERLRYAINYGADAVYCALPEFGMRSAPTNFTPEQLRQAVAFCHARGVRVHVTLNTLVTDREMPALLDQRTEEEARELCGALGTCLREHPDTWDWTPETLAETLGSYGAYLDA